MRVTVDYVITLVVFAMLALGLMVLSVVPPRRRRAAMAAYAESRGWRFAERDPLLVDRFTGPPFGQGNRRRATNVVHGSHDGRDFVSFDYQYRTSTGGSWFMRVTPTVHVSVLAFSMGAPLDELAISDGTASPAGIDATLAVMATIADQLPESVRLRAKEEA